MISIYDFSILPYALGDILTWNVKQCVKAIAQGQDFIDVYIHCGDPVNVHQDKYVNEGNEKSFMYDILPAFYTNPMLRNVHLFHDQAAMCQALSENDATHHFGRWSKDMIIHDINKILYNEICSHSDINTHFANKGSVPHLVAPRGFDPRSCKETCFIGLNIRSRMKDQSLGPIDPHRDSNVDSWASFIKKVRLSNPDIWFFLLGKPESQHRQILDLPNVSYPRSQSYWGLGQELAIIPNCSGFMGSCSGFAAMAVFGKKPYVITKLTNASWDFYGVPAGQKHLPFASDKQFLMREDESVDSLMWYFERLLVQ